jgi:AcrR family transcriptional regulator
MQDIADEADLSKAALHYHYDTKRDLLTAFLDSLAAWHEGRLEDLPGDDAAARLRALFDECLRCAEHHEDATTDADADAAAATTGDGDTADTDYPAFHTAMLEVKAQAPYADAYRERLTVVDDVLRSRVRDIVADGVEAGVFRPVDPDATATFVVDVLVGAFTRNVATGHPLDETRALLDDYVDDHLLATAESEAATDPDTETHSPTGATR